MQSNSNSLSTVNSSKIDKGYTCPCCIEYLTIWSPFPFKSFHNIMCKSCSAEIHHNEAHYCHKCCMQKVICHSCGSSICNGQESIKNVKSFFEDLWFDEEDGDEYYLNFEIKGEGFSVISEEEFDKMSEEEVYSMLYNLKTKKINDIVEKVKAKYFGKSREEVLEMSRFH